MSSSPPLSSSWNPPPKVAGNVPLPGGKPSVAAPKDAPKEPPLGAEIDPELVQQTKLQIRSIIQEVANLSQTAISPEDYFAGFLKQVVSALAAEGGAIWLTAADGAITLQYQVNLPKKQLVDDKAGALKHNLLLKKTLVEGQPTLVPPRSGAIGEEDAGNPTDTLIVLAPLKQGENCVGLVEIFQRAGGGPTTQRGFLRFLAQMADLAGEYLRNRHLKLFQEKQRLWEQLEQFLSRLHVGLDPKQVAYTLANEGRRLLECDRLSVCIAQGNYAKPVAVSGLDSFDRRSQEIAKLGRLASAVLRSRDPLWHGIDSGALPPQIEGPLHDYVDQSQARLLAVVPLFAPSPATVDRNRKARKPLGVLVIEKLTDVDPASLKQRVDMLTRHAELALHNAKTHHDIFLLPLWLALGNSAVVRNAKLLPRMAVVGLGVAAIGAALCLIPADFDLATRGKLVPSERQDVFARHKGTVVEVLVDNKDFVEIDQPLAKMIDADLDAEIIRLSGEARAAQDRLESISFSLTKNARMRPEEQEALQRDEKTLLQQIRSAGEQIKLARRKQQELTIRSEITGQVMDWKLKEKLFRRPVERGQVLMTIANQEGPWELELQLPEKRVGKLSQALANREEALQVEFTLSTHPDQRFYGQVIQIDPIAEVRGEDGNTVRVRVAIDKEELPELHADTTVSAEIQCGKRPLGYVLFVDVFETVYGKFLLWF
jgi:multidrug efflux pump subunit AcrA (membrane-fusion protein)